MYFGKLTAFCLILASSLHISSQQSALCDEAGDVIKHEQGQTYTYNFSSVTTLHKDHHTGGNILVDAQAYLMKIAPCEYVLSLDTINLRNKTSIGSKKSTMNTVTTVRFTKRNGIVDTFFVAASEYAWTNNVARAIASMLQNKAFASTSTPATTMEMSISGHCPVDHFHQPADNKYLKTTNLNKCSQRETSPKKYLGTPYDTSPNSVMNSNPMLNSSSFCEQVVKDNVVMSVSCSEEHNKICLIKTSEWSTRVRSTLQLLSGAAAKFTAAQIDEESKKASTPSSIIFDQQLTSTANMKTFDNADGRTIEQRIRVILGHLENDIDQADYFMQLLEAFKELQDPDQIYSSKTDPALTKKQMKLFVDAAAKTDTLPSLLFIAKMEEKDPTALKMLTKIKFYRTISFSMNPEQKGVEALVSLINSGNGKNLPLTNQLLIAASGYAHQFCRVHPSDCATADISTSISKYAVYDKAIESASVFDTTTSIASLHALGNLQALSTAATEAISKILSDATVSDWFKVLALQAFRSNPCVATLKDKAKALFEDAKGSDDLRIHAYLAFSKCIMPADVATIEKILTDSTAVGQFIASHIRNIQDSSSPSMRKMRASVAVIKVASAAAGFKPLILTHNSNFVEYSSFDPKHNLGFSASITTIFSKSGSKIPIFVSLDLKIDAMGMSYDVLEAGISLRSVNQFLEEYVKRDGHLCSECLIKLLQSPNFHDSYFRKFGLTVKIGDLDRVLETIGHSVKNVFDGIKVNNTKMDIVSTLPHVLLDLEWSYPTVSGLPLTFEFQAGSIHSVSVDINGEFDFMGFIRSTREQSVAKFESLVKKSASITLQNSMKIGRPHLTPMTAGIRTERNVDTLTVVGVDFTKQKGKFEVMLRLPNEDITTVSFSKNTFFFQEIEGDFEKLPHGSPMVMMMSVPPPPTCYKAMEMFIGLSPCVLYYRPLSAVDMSSLIVNVTMKKTDKEMQGFKFHYKIEPGSDGNSVFSLILDTPGSQTKRNIFLETKVSNLAAAEGKWGTSWDGKLQTAYSNLTFAFTTQSSDSGHKCENSLKVTFSDGGLHEWSWTLNLGKFDVNDPMYPLIGVIRPSYDLQITYTNPKKEMPFKAHAVLLKSKYDGKDGKNITAAFTFNGEKMLQNTIGDFNGHYYRFDDPKTSGRRINELAVSMNAFKSKNLKVDVTVNANKEKCLDKTISSRVEVAGKVFEYNSVTRVEDEKFTEEVWQGNYYLNASLKQTPGDNLWKADGRILFKKGSTRNYDARLQIDSNRPKSPVILAAIFTHDPAKLKAQIQVNVKNEDCVNFLYDYSKIDDSKDSFTMRAMIKERFELDGNLMKNTKDVNMNTTIQAKCLTLKKWLKYSSSFSRSADRVYTKHEEATWGTGDKTNGNGVCDATLDLTKKTIVSTYEITHEKKKVTANLNGAQVDGHTDLTLKVGIPDNGLTTLHILNDLTGAVGAVDKPVKDSLQIKVNNDGGKFEPRELKVDVTYNQRGKDVYNESATTDVQFTKGPAGALKNDVKIMHLLEWKWNAAYDMFGLLGKTNYEDKGSDAPIKKFESEGSFDLTPSGSGVSLKNAGVIWMNASVQLEQTKNAISVNANYQNPADKMAHYSQSTFKATTTDVAKGETTVFFEGESNSTKIFTACNDFESTEIGQVTVKGEKITWEEVVRLTKEEFVFKYDIGKGNGTFLLLDLQLQIRDENGQLHFAVKSDNNLPYEATKFNFTLTR